MLRICKKHCDERLKNGGHIGDGIRIGERRKGYAAAMPALASDRGFI